VALGRTSPPYDQQNNPLINLIQNQVETSTLQFLIQHSPIDFPIICCNTFAVEEETIVLGATTYTYKALSNAGAVYSFSCNSSSCCSWKTSSIQWSVQQVLYA
jgi:hypothetical protein